MLAALLITCGACLPRGDAEDALYAAGGARPDGGSDACIDGDPCSLRANADGAAGRGGSAQGAARGSAAGAGDFGSSAGMGSPGIAIDAGVPATPDAAGEPRDHPGDAGSRDVDPPAVDAGPAAQPSMDASSGDPAGPAQGDGGDVIAPMPDGGDSSAPMPDGGDSSAPMPDGGDVIEPTPEDAGRPHADTCAPFSSRDADGGAGDDCPPAILVDASRDGGGWWFPQAGTYDADQSHQGKGLADYLRAQGYQVDELPREPLPTLTLELLSRYRIVVRANAYGSYLRSEIDAYRRYVELGGNLLLLADHVRPWEQDEIGEAFGVVFEGVSQGENLVRRFEAHPLTLGVTVLPYGVGSGIAEHPSDAVLLGYLGVDTYLDLDEDRMQDPEEPVAAPVLGAMPLGDGRVVFCGDMNLWEQVPQPLVDNMLAYFE